MLNHNDLNETEFTEFNLISHDLLVKLIIFVGIFIKLTYASLCYLLDACCGIFQDCTCKLKFCVQVNSLKLNVL